MTMLQKPYQDKLQNHGKADYAGIDELWANEKYLTRYNADIVKKLSQYSQMKSDVLEFGAGLGTLASIWQNRKNVKPDCLEIDDTLRTILVQRGFNTYQTLDAINKQYDVIYTSNVLEHIEDDLETLKKLNGYLKPNGVLAIYVPAFMFLYSALDTAVGHYRRYEKSELVNKLRAANFSIEKAHYVDSVGFFAWLYSKYKKYSSDEKEGLGKKLKIYDTYLYPISKLFDFLGVSRLFGKNLLVIAKKST